MCQPAIQMQAKMCILRLCAVIVLFFCGAVSEISAATELLGFFIESKAQHVASFERVCLWCGFPVQFLCCVSCSSPIGGWMPPWWCCVCVCVCLSLSPAAIPATDRGVLPGGVHCQSSGEQQQPLLSIRGHLECTSRGRAGPGDASTGPSHDASPHLGPRSVCQSREGPDHAYHRPHCHRHQHCSMHCQCPAPSWCP